MAHLPFLPVLIPLVAAVLLLMAAKADIDVKRGISAIAVGILVTAALTQLIVADDGTVRVYRLGDWPAPYGIVLVLDRLAALMVALTSVLAMPVFLAATSGTDARGPHFHAFLQFQLMGLNGAFLTGDLFNLFVFFEILLLASYGLLVHGGGLQRARAGIAYVVLNLSGSALFLIALGLLYGLLGTLNMADFGVALQKVAPEDQGVVAVMCALLVTVFLLKAAVLPIGFWLPQVYTAATLPVAALFVIMTKVGVYALLRVTTIGLMAAPFTADLLQPWLTWLALGTIAVGAMGMLAASSLGMVVANLVLVSGGTLLLAVAEPGAQSIAAALYYLVQTTLVTAALFLLADALARQRGDAEDQLAAGPPLQNYTFLGLLFLVFGVAACGAPPLSGFIGKIMVMQAMEGSVHPALIWTALILSGFVAALVLARAASVFFWEPGAPGIVDKPSVAYVPAPGLMLAMILLTVGIVAVSAAAAPVAAYTRAAAEQILARDAYVSAVIGDPAAVQREKRP
ncbi:MAG: monovalent cation/H+ antiporter subunit D [Hyphomicrobium sp. 32-62-53]|nr:MAG: monovalent cation/H+ antiporter subunit D [Hyphomicrobium sp. 12-62-95]OYX99392.1 MAG: monovalent cation/H+ antiporter subunit D [Hyphomicrobium sp. 32-62-53]